MTKENFRKSQLWPMWSLIEVVGTMRQEQKNQFGESMTKDAHVIGLAGEVVASYILWQQMDATPRYLGDGGYDFPCGTDVKTTKYWPPILKHPVNAKLWPDYFALVYLDIDTKEGYWIGRVSADILRNHNRQEKFGSDKPVNYTMTMEEVYKYSDTA